MVIVPLLVSVPAIFNVAETLVISVAALATVKLLQEAVLPITGMRVAAAGMVTFTVDVGTEPEHQLLASFQSVLMFPVHCPATEEAITLV